MLLFKIGSITQHECKMFDVVYYINLKHRTDRRAQIEEELCRVGWGPISQRIEAVYIPEHGALGALKSHILVLETLLASTFTSAAILEDDCSFKFNPNTLLDKFQAEHTSHSLWDVVLMAAGLFKYELYKPYASRVLDAQTASAYIITREFAKELLDLWYKTVDSLEKTRAHEFCLDISWKVLQPSNKWFCLEPKPAYQRPSYSDIEKRDVNYGV